MGKRIILTTLNSTYQHSAFGLRYLFANLKDLKQEAQILEFTIETPVFDIVESLLSYQPQIIGFGVYIWNLQQTTQVVQILKKISPSTVIILGGPEVSYENKDQELCLLADVVISGEADLTFYEICKKIFINESTDKFVQASVPELSNVLMPYDLYSEEDLKNRFIYVEASRGCVYKCEYCLSSLDKNVRPFDTDKFLQEIDQLFSRGARNFKFVDRTFNLNIQVSEKILQYFADRVDQNIFVHFEMVPDRLPDQLKKLLPLFPAGALQFEIGIQTVNPATASLISRKNNLTKIKENLNFLREHTKVHTHADLIVGLPAESLQTFAEGFDWLYQLAPDEIQVGILKRLKGTPITRHQDEFQMQYQSEPPYQILKTSTMSFDEVLLMTRFSRYWDMIANSGKFKNFMKEVISPNPFYNFQKLTYFLFARFRRTYKISFENLMQALYDFCSNQNFSSSEALSCLKADFESSTHQAVPEFLKGHILTKRQSVVAKSSLSKRQRQHLGPNSEASLRTPETVLQRQVSE